MIRMTSNKKESMVQAVRRAMGNAFVNNKIVTMIFEGVEFLVYPVDDLMSILRYVRQGVLVQQIAMLEKQLAGAK